jgi:phage gp36-like protein
MFLTNTEMKTHLYAENISVIQRDDVTILTAAIQGAVVEARGYLMAYDVGAVFEAEGEARNPLLLIFVKDIATWHFLVLCNAGHELRLRQDRYDRAIAWLRGVQKGDIDPDLPKADDSGIDAAAIVKFGSNPKRGQHF